jgi:hypothetical protein
MVRELIAEMRSQGVTRFAAALEDATVHIEINQYLCVDGRPFHDMKGQLTCPACGFAPKLAS